MQRLVRGSVIVARLVAVLVALGCVRGAPGGSRGTGVEHVVVAENTGVAPVNASTVDASAPESADAEAVRDALTEAATDEDGVALVRVSERRFAALNRTVAAISGVASRIDDEAGAATPYVEYEGDAYRVTVRKR